MRDANGECVSMIASLMKKLLVVKTSINVRKPFIDACVNAAIIANYLSPTNMQNAGESFTNRIRELFGQCHVSIYRVVAADEHHRLFLNFIEDISERILHFVLVDPRTNDELNYVVQCF